MVTEHEQLVSQDLGPSKYSVYSSYYDDSTRL